MRPCCKVAATWSGKLVPCPSSIVHLSSKRNHYLSVIKKDLRIHLNLPVTIQGWNRSATTRAMLDSGASTTFLSETFAKRHRVATTPLTTPIALYNADGSVNAIGQITHEAHLIMRIRTHQERITADELGHELDARAPCKSRPVSQVQRRERGYGELLSHGPTGMNTS